MEESGGGLHLEYTLDVVNMDDLSDGSNSGPAARKKANRRSKAGKRLSAPGPKFTPPSPPSRTAAPETPSTPLASSSRLPDVFDSTSPSNTQTPVATAFPSVPQPTSESSKVDIDPQKLWYANAYLPSAMRTFHCEKVKKMPLSGLDPSMLLGFLCKDEADFEDFCERVSKVSRICRTSEKQC